VTFNESVLVEGRAAPFTRTLLFPADRVVSVRDAKRGIEYAEAVDWSFDRAAGQLVFPAGSKVLFVTPEQRPQGMSNWAESRFFHDRQLAVTYTHAPDLWTGPVPARAALPRSRDKLRRRQPFVLGVLGDSISQGFNASGCGRACSALAPALVEVAPFSPPWPDLVVQRLAGLSGGAITKVNVATAGWTASDALASPRFQELLDAQPDAVVVAFGVNDGNPTPLSPAAFAGNVAQIVARLRQPSPQVEILLVSPQEVNPETFLWSDVRKDYEEALEPLANGRDVVLVRMSQVHKTLLARKTYLDMTGNGVNHPNDYLQRWYAQQIAEALAPID
jgi:lysophospholipase L1-like esterase